LKRLISSVTASIENFRLPAMLTGLHGWQSAITSLKEELYVLHPNTVTAGGALTSCVQESLLKDHKISQ